MTTAVQATPRPRTFSALSNANFRLYFAGQLVSTAGTWMQNVAQGFLVVQLIIRLTHSPQVSNLWLGIVACAAGLPLVLLSPVSGVIVERIPRRRIMLVTQTVQMLLAFVLAALAFAGTVQVWHIVLLAFCLGITNAVDQPSRQSFVVEMVGRDELQSGIQLNSILVSSSRVLGPAAAGVALVAVGAPWCFLINGSSFLAVIASLLLMNVPHEIKYSGEGKPSALKQMREGLAYARTDAVILPLLLLVATVGFFGLPVLQFFAAFAATALKSPDVGYSALSIAQGVGSVVAGGFVGWLGFRLGRGRLVGYMIRPGRDRQLRVGASNDHSTGGADERLFRLVRRFGSDHPEHNDTICRAERVSRARPEPVHARLFRTFAVWRVIIGISGRGHQPLNPVARHFQYQSAIWGYRHCRWTGRVCGIGRLGRRVDFTTLAESACAALNR